MSVEKNSLVDRILRLIQDLKKTPRALTVAEEQVIAELLFHPDLPRFFATRDSAPKVARVPDKSE